MATSTSRLRKTFKYPTDEDEDDDEPEAMDEEGTFASPLCALVLLALFPAPRHGNV
jgi:hypothetical protein